ncbi:hypothetical protein ACIRRA_43965 [Nocardia sp. NPDC101769]|uniref:hypothetical protein n=1 Tax=Nocardia sp. NPDC101769 TaxID=3364333 RepID=UPI0038037BC7
MSKLLSFAAVGVWPLAVLAIAVTLVTVIALCRAERDDIPTVFESFAAAFGIHRRDGKPDGAQKPPLAPPNQQETADGDPQPSQEDL